VWRSAPRQLLVAGTLQVLAGLSVAAQLLVIRRLLTNINAAEGIPTASDLGLDLALFGALVIVVGIATVTQKEQQLMLGDRVHKYTTAPGHGVSTSVDLIEYEKPSFHDRLQRARVNANIRPLQMANGVIGLIGSGVGVAAVGAALLFIEPVVAALIVVGGVPTMILNRLSSSLMHAFAVRRRTRTGDARTSTRPSAARRRPRRSAPSTAARTCGPSTTGSSTSASRTSADGSSPDRLRHAGQPQRRRGVTVGSLVLLLLFVRTGRTTATDAVVALGAVLLIAGRIRALTGSMGSLYEGSLFLEDFTGFVEEYAAATTGPSTANADTGFERIDLDRVSFTYPSRTNRACGRLAHDPAGRGDRARRRERVREDHADQAARRPVPPDPRGGPLGRPIDVAEVDLAECAST
jgi:ATP-binding cassette, subfamily B, bacterial